MIGLGVFAAIGSSLWAMGQWRHRQIRESIDLLLYLEEQIEERRKNPSAQLTRE